MTKSFENPVIQKKGALGNKARMQTINELISLNEFVNAKEWFENRLKENRVALGLTPYPASKAPGRIASLTERIQELESQLAQYQQSELSAMVR